MAYEFKLTSPKSKSKVQVQVLADNWVFIKNSFSNQPTHPPTRKVSETGMDLTMWGPWAQNLVGALFLSAEVKKTSWV